MLDITSLGFPGDAVVKNPPADEGDARDVSCIRRSGRYPGGGNGNPPLPGKSHGQRSMEGYSSWCRNELDTTERLSTNICTTLQP